MQSSGFRSRKDGDNFLKQQYKSGENRRESGELRAFHDGNRLLLSAVGCFKTIVAN
jgi:hypothetical protein